MVFELEIFGDGPVDLAVLVGVVDLFVFAGTVPDVGLKRAVWVDVRTVTNDRKFGDLLVRERLPAVLTGGVLKARPCVG